MNADRELSHQQAAELLPWLLNDTLEAQERAAVLAHTRGCVTCRRDLEELTSLHRTIDRTAGHVAAPADTVAARRAHALIREAGRSPFERLWAKVAGTCSQPGDRPAGRGMLGTLRSLGAQPLRTAVIVQGVALIALAGAVTALLLTDRGEDAAFVTLTGGEALPEGRFIRVVLHPEADAGRIGELTQRLDLEIFEGPTRRGIYTLSARSTDDDAWSAALTALENETDVLFVQGLTVGSQP